jgi:hypothetical protein
MAIYREVLGKEIDSVGAILGSIQISLNGIPFALANSFNAHIGGKSSSEPNPLKCPCF